MTPDRWQEIQALFLAVVDLDPAARARYLAEACAADPTLRDEVLALLTADRRSAAEPFITDAVAAAARAVAAGAGEGAGRIGERVGPYRLLREIGHGGMGTVYLAERADEQYRASVAIKFVRGVLAAPELARRLRAERQILADLTHPNIAWLLDGGTAQDGTPYIVMEYVDGAPIDIWCDRHGLGLMGRLALFGRVCAAVQHAHQALVVHRDLKPSNILVMADGTPKLVDFGIAKLLAPDDGADTTETVRLMTPAYAAPEQVSGGRITVATDVYALGGILYRLLAGRTSLDLVGASGAEVERRIREEVPAAPSQAATGPAAAWRRRLRGDLDTITLKALRKEPEHRYASVEQLSQDIARYLAGEPVLARPASGGYRLGKFLRRHRTAAAAGLLVFVSLAVGLGVALGQRARAERARRETVAALAQSNATRDFLLELFRANDPRRSFGREVTARELLARGLERVDSLGDQPALQAELLHILGRIELSLANYQNGLTLVRRSLATHGRAGSPDSALVDVYVALGNAMNELGWPDSAAAAWQTAVDIGTRALGEDHPSILGPIGSLGIAYGRLGQHDRAEAAYRRQIAIQERVLGRDVADRAYPLNNLALLYANDGRFTQAEPLFRECLRILLAAFGEEDPITAYGYDNFGVMLREAGRYDEGEPLMRSGLAIRRKALGHDHRYTAESYLSLGKLLAHRGRGNDFTEADSLLTRALTIYRARLGREHPAVAYVLHALGVLAYNRGRLADSERWFREALALRRRAGGRDDPAVTVQTLTALGHTLRDRHAADAGDVMRAADSLARARLDPEHPFRRRAEIGYALVLADGGELARAGPLFADGVRHLAARIGGEHPYVRLACVRGRAHGLSAEPPCA